MIGLIIPPSEIKTRVERTAKYVAENGQEFEMMLWEKEQNDPKFSFMKRDNPYRGYYDYMINEFRKKLLEEAQQQQETKARQEEYEIKNTTPLPFAIDQQQRAFLQKAFQEIKAPDPEYYLAEVPEKLSWQDRQIIMHTAQYVARNGKGFLEALSEREKNNKQFEFLRSGSDNHKYFTRLVDGYSRILSNPLGEIERLNMIINEKDSILNRCVEKFEYQRRQQQSKTNKKVEVDKEKDKQIDWNDFELVETIVFEDDILPSKPVIPVIEDLAEQVRKKLMLQTTILDKPIEQIITITKKKVMQQCSVCEKQVPASQMNTHLKKCMMDPKYKEKREQQLKRQAESSGIGLSISQNLNSLMAHRPDIGGAQSFQLEQQEFKQQQPEKIIWDGQAANMTRTTASIAMMDHQQRKLAEMNAKMAASNPASTTAAADANKKKAN